MKTGEAGEVKQAALRETECKAWPRTTGNC